MIPQIARVRATAAAALLAGLVLVAAGCSTKKATPTTTTDSTATTAAPAPAGDTTAAAPVLNTMPVAPATPPDHVEVIHVLVAFDGSIPNHAPIGRSKAQAETLAKEVLERARKGEDFDALMVQYSNDTEPGVLYKLSNTGVTPDKAHGEYGRGDMVKGFGDVAFSLSPGNIGMTPYDPKASPFGWHIIKRLN